MLTLALWSIWMCSLSAPSVVHQNRHRFNQFNFTMVFLYIQHLELVVLIVKGIPDMGHWIGLWLLYLTTTLSIPVQQCLTTTSSDNHRYRNHSCAWISSCSSCSWTILMLYPPALPSMTTKTNDLSQNVVFVGNLSYFCEEQHLRDLFDQYGRIERIRVCRSEDQLKPLQYGFVTMSTRVEAERLVEMFHEHLFMGRKLRYVWTSWWSI